MNPRLLSLYVPGLVRLAVGAIFIYASVYKIMDPAGFAQQVFNYRILPAWAINPAAIVLPWLQLVCGVALVLNRWVVAASLWIVLMMAAFQLALGSALARGLNVSCGCFEAGGEPATWLTFFRDTAILLAALFVLQKSLVTRVRRNQGLWMFWS